MEIRIFWICAVFINWNFSFKCNFFYLLFLLIFASFYLFGPFLSLFVFFFLFLDLFFRFFNRCISFLVRCCWGGSFQVLSLIVSILFFLWFACWSSSGIFGSWSFTFSELSIFCGWRCLFGIKLDFFISHSFPFPFSFSLNLLFNHVFFLLLGWALVFDCLFSSLRPCSH